MTPSSANASGFLTQQRFAARVLTLSALGLVLGCGGGTGEDDGFDVGSFSGFGQGGTSATGAPPLGNGGAAGTGAPVNMELGNGGAVSVLPPAGTGGTGMVTMPPPVTMMQACQASSASCQGAAVVSCNAEGTALTTQQCGANSTCALVNGAPTCQSTVAPTCTANQTFCDTANVVGTCNAEGTAFTTQRCPNGQNCTAGGCQPVACSQQGMLSANGNGGVTVYWFAQGTITNSNDPNQDVNCSFDASRAANDDGGANDRVAFIQDPALFGALNFTQWGNGAACGACVQINPINGGQPTTITIADSCNPSNNNPTCTSGHIDLSRAAFQRVANASTGDFNGVSWRFVPCDNVDNVQFRLKEPNNQYWNEFVVMNHRFPIVRAQVMMEDGPEPGSSDGRWVDAERGGFGNPNDPNTYYNYWRTREGTAPDFGEMGTFRVRVTDINGSIIEQQLELGPDVITSDGQFGCQ